MDIDQLIIVTLGLINDDEFLLSVHQVRNETGRLIADVINKRWIQSFLERFNIMNRIRTGKKEFSLKKILQSHREMSFHLGKMKREYENGLQKCDVENFDESHFEFDLTNGRVLDFKGKKCVSYAEVSVGERNLCCA